MHTPDTHCIHLQESVPVYLSQIGAYLSTLDNHQRISKVTSLLHSLATAGLIPTRLASIQKPIDCFNYRAIPFHKCRSLCEELLSRLDIKNEMVWTESLELVRKVIGGVDYKVSVSQYGDHLLVSSLHSALLQGCRDVMNILLDKYDRLPRNVPEEQVGTLLKGQEVSLLPI